MRISDWSSDVCSSDLQQRQIGDSLGKAAEKLKDSDKLICRLAAVLEIARETDFESDSAQAAALKELLSETKFLANELESAQTAEALREIPDSYADLTKRSEEHTSELQSLMRISYAVFCLKKNTHKSNNSHSQRYIKY